MNNKLEDFSDGLWRLEVELIPFTGDRPEMSIEDIKPFLIESDTDEPLLIRIRGTYLQVWLSSSQPYKSVAVPESYQEILGIELPQTLYALIPKNQDKMKQILDSSEDNLAWKLDSDDFKGGNIP